MSWRDYENEQPEHECPTPLQREVAEFDAGGMFWSPAGRWETITDRSSYAETSAQVTITTGRTGSECSWTFWRSDKFPYLDGWKASQARYVVVRETHSTIEVSVGAQQGYGRDNHTLISAHQVRGTGWQIMDRPSGAGELEQVTVPNRARARSEVNRRARAHAKRLGVPVWRGGAS
jgi:hypothetical protein